MRKGIILAGGAGTVAMVKERIVSAGVVEGGRPGHGFQVGFGETFVYANHLREYAHARPMGLGMNAAAERPGVELLLHECEHAQATFAGLLVRGETDDVL